LRERITSGCGHRDAPHEIKIAAPVPRPVRDNVRARVQ
jgi:hypothetical protein